MTWLEFALIIIGVLVLLALFNWVFIKQYPTVLTPGFIRAVNTIVVILLVVWAVAAVTGVGRFWNARVG